MAKDLYVMLGMSFRDIVEAYHVLSDPRRRAATDRALRHDLEPLVPDPISLMRDFEVGSPSTEEVFDRFVQSYTGRHATKSQTSRALRLQLEVSPEQALRGGLLTISVPVLYPCAVCGGTGRDWQYQCTGCGGRGIVAAEEPVRLHVPPRLRDGDVVEVPLGGLGVPDQVLRIAFRVGV